MTKAEITQRDNTTYGEAHFKRTDSIFLEDGKFQTIDLPPHNPRMGKQEAGIYYTKKINSTMQWNRPTINFEARIDGAFKKVRRETNRMIKREMRKMR